MKTAINLYYTAPFPSASRSQLESTLLAASQYLEFSPFYEPAFDGLSPSDLFKHLNFSFSPLIPYALIADSRTLAEISSNADVPTVIVVSAQSITPNDEWERYTGPGDLSLLSDMVRLALLRALVEERVSLDPHTSDAFWAHPSRRGTNFKFTDELWQIKTLRADAVGADYACMVYPVKDINDMHALYSEKAATTGGVFRGLM